MTWAQILPIIISIIAILVTVFTVIWTRSADKEDKALDEIRKALEGKVDKEDCEEHQESVKRFKERIGIESDAHRKSITRLEKGMIFVVQKLGGDPGAMGLMD